jgi:hypothetical protein
MRTLLAVFALLLTGCSTIPPASPRDEFFARLLSLCGKAFEGHIVSLPAEANRDFAGKRLVMHIRDCSADTIRIPFHVGENRSRTWVISRTASRLRLKHDHRHEDGSEEVGTQYGGDTVTQGTATRQFFPFDQYTQDLFIREKWGTPQTWSFAWSMDVELGRMFTYEVHRPYRFFRVDFDLGRSVAPPPLPWGSR